MLSCRAFAGAHQDAPTCCCCCCWCSASARETSAAPPPAPPPLSALPKPPRHPTSTPQPFGGASQRPAEQCDPAALTALRSPLLASCGARPRPRPPRPQRGLPPASLGGFWGCPSSGLASPQPPPRFPLRAPGVRAPEPAGAIAFPRPPGVQPGMLSAAFALPTRAQVVFLFFYYFYIYIFGGPNAACVSGAGRDGAAAKHKNSPGCEWLVATWGFHT